MKNFLLTLVVLISTNQMIAQTKSFLSEWSNKLGGTGVDQISKTISDKQGNLYVIGTFSQTVDFDFSASTELRTSAGELDIFILKIDKKGDFIWVKTIGSYGLDSSSDIEIDKANNLVISGFYSGTVDFDPSANVHNMSSTGNSPSGDAFVLKLSNDGVFIWSVDFASTVASTIYEIALDDNGNIYGTGSFQGDIDFDEYTQGNEHSGTSNNYHNILMFKLNGSGTLIWSDVVLGNSFNNVGESITVSIEGEVFVSGTFGKTVDFNTGTGTNNITSNANSQDVYILKLDTNGVFQWATNIGGDSYDKTGGLALNIDGDLYISGSFKNTVNFDPLTNNNIFTSKGQSDAFLLQLDANGLFKRVFILAGKTEVNANNIFNDPYGNLFLTGGFTDSVFVDIVGVYPDTIISNGISDAYILELDEEFLPLFIGSIVSDNNSSSFYGPSLTFPSKDKLVISGVFSGLTNMDINNLGTQNLQSEGDNDGFIVCYNKPIPDAVAENKLGLTLKVYPNPNQGTFTVATNISGEKTIQIVSVDGKLVQQTTTNQKKIKIDLANIKPGFYLINLTTKNLSKTQQIIFK